MSAWHCAPGCGPFRKGRLHGPSWSDFPKNACYTVNEALYLRGFTHVTFNGNGTEFQENDPTVSTIGPLPLDHPYCGSSIDNQSGTTMSAIPIIWWFEGGCDITLADVRIVGPNRDGVVGSETDSGIQLSGVQQATIEGVTEQDVDGDFVTVTGLHEGSPESGGGIAIFPSRYVVIRNSHFTRSGRQGITPQYVDHLTVEDNTFSDVAFTNIDLEADEPGGCACNVAVDHNTFVGPLAYLVAGLTGLSIQNFSFSDNTLTAGAQMKVQFAPQLASSNIVIAGNTGQTPSDWPWPSIGVAYSVNGDSGGPVTNVVIRDNTIPAPQGGRVFVLAGTQASDVHVILESDNRTGQYRSARQPGSGLQWDVREQRRGGRARPRQCLLSCPGVSTRRQRPSCPRPPISGLMTRY